MSPSGSCHLRLLESLADEFDFTVFSGAFDNPDPARIRWVRTPSVTRPLAARYVSYYMASTVARALDRRPHGAYDLVQAVEGYTGGCDISYVHFCHRAYLRRYASEATEPGVHEAVRRLDHRLRAAGEARALASPRLIVVPSATLKAELEQELDVEPGRLRVIPNPVEVGDYDMPTGFPRASERAELGAPADALLAVFVALGHFERKGLSQLLEAMASTSERVRLAVVGGHPNLVAQYRARAAALGVSSRVSFLGMQADVRPYLWSADVFVSPSSYETFSLALHQAAAARLPLVVTPRAGAASFFANGVHGRVITRQPEVIATALNELSAMAPAERDRLGANARRAVEGFGVSRFAGEWRAIYREALGATRSAA